MMSQDPQPTPQNVAVNEVSPGETVVSPGTQCTPLRSIPSITRHSPASPRKKIAALAMLLHGLTLEAFFTRRLRVSKTQFFQVVNGRRESKSLRERIADDLTVSVNDIWPHEQTGLRFDSRKTRHSA